MMKKVSFLVALLAMVQITMGHRNALAQQPLPSDRLAVEEALDRAGQDVADELERLVEELGGNSDQLSQALERWAEANAQELEAWSNKYAKKWESWGNRFERKLERLAQEQEGIWQRWAEDYEQDLNRWANELESELSPEHLGEFVERNLNRLSKMPLGQMVDQVLEDGVGELGEAPWESLEELGALAKQALEEPIGEITESLDKERNAGPQTKDALRQDRSTSSNVDPRIRALRKLRQRDKTTPAQRERIDLIIRTLTDAKLQKDSAGDAVTDRPRIDVPRVDQIKKKVEREKSRQEQALQQFNDDLRRSNKESRKSQLKARELDSRQPKRVDGETLDPNSKGNQKSGKGQLRRGQRDGRSPQGSSGQSSDRPAKQSAQGQKIDSELETLRREIEKLRNEVNRLKKSSKDNK